MSERDGENGQGAVDENGPAAADGSLDDVETSPWDSDGRDDEQVGLVDEVQEAMPTERLDWGIDPRDGLPSPLIVDTDAARAPDFYYDTVVCIEDDRTWVEVWSTELPEPATQAWYAWSEFEDGLELRKVMGKELGFVVRARHAYRFDGGELRPNNRNSVKKSAVVNKLGMKLALAGVREDGLELYMPVRPVRPRCRHYKRQCWADDSFAPSGEFMGQYVARNCMARRTVGGAFLSLRDEAIYACEYRDPPDERSVEKYLDGPDRRRLLEAARKREVR